MRLILLAWLIGAIVLLPNARAQSNCDSAYPTVCIASPPPDLDCKDIPYRNFEVHQPDPHHFDGDNDGIGCEPPPQAQPRQAQP
jgi:hypothetical protein